MSDTGINPVNKRILEIMVAQGVNFACSLPCSWLVDLINLVDSCAGIRHIPVTTEEEGIGICAGSYFAGKRPLMLMQNSGLGRCVNALASLNEVYQIPLLMMMSHRGTEGEKIEAQKPMGRYSPGILEVMGIPYLMLTEDNLGAFAEFIRRCYQSNKPAAVFMKEMA